MLYPTNRLVLVALAWMAVATTTFSQSYSNAPNDTINMEGVMEDLETLSIQQLNTSSDTIQLKWAKVSETVPALWEASVCDNAICYTTLQDSGSMNPIYPADYGFVLLHITPHVNYGTAVIRYAVWDIANPALKDTLTYILTVTATTGIAAAETKNAILLFPNPAKESISITNNLQKSFEYSIADITGKEIANGISNNQTQTISTAKWNNGHYIISISSENKVINTTKIIVQQ